MLLLSHKLKSVKMNLKTLANVWQQMEVHFLRHLFKYAMQEEN